jgi:hypothetical protein
MIEKLEVAEYCKWSLNSQAVRTTEPSGKRKDLESFVSQYRRRANL